MSVSVPTKAPACSKEVLRPARPAAAFAAPTGIDVEQEMERLGWAADQAAINHGPPPSGSGCSFGAGNFTGASSIW